MKVKTAWRWNDLPQLIDCETAAKILKANLRVIQTQCKQGKLPAKKILNKWYIDTELLRKEFEI